MSTTPDFTAAELQIAHGTGRSEYGDLFERIMTLLKLQADYRAKEATD